MRDFFGLDAYKKLWREEISRPRGLQALATVVRNWAAVREAFAARNVLVHGRDRYTRNRASGHISALLKGAQYVDEYCEELGFPLHGRMPVRRKRCKPI